MKIDFWFSWQIGIMFTCSKNYEKRKYITIELPFLTAQLFWFKPK
jgi:hypothetical protein